MREHQILAPSLLTLSCRTMACMMQEYTRSSSFRCTAAAFPVFFANLTHLFFSFSSLIPFFPRPLTLYKMAARREAFATANGTLHNSRVGNTTHVLHTCHARVFWHGVLHSPTHAFLLFRYVSLFFFRLFFLSLSRPPPHPP